MLKNAFAGHPKPPTEKELSAKLGDTKQLWDELLEDLSADFKLEPEWNSYSIKAGWSLRLKQKDRNIVYLTPGDGSFMASFALGERAMKSALAADFPKPIVKILKEAKHYTEGTAVRIEVHSASDLDAIRKLVEIKIKN